MLDGIPTTDNRSPGYGPEIEADSVQSMSIYTAGIPAKWQEYGRSNEVNSAPIVRASTDSSSSREAASTAPAVSPMLQYLSGKNTFGVSANGAMTDVSEPSGCPTIRTMGRQGTRRQL